MDGNFYTETCTYREGRILIYKHPHSKNFQCRLRVEGIKDYIIKSCKTSNQGKAFIVTKLETYKHRTAFLCINFAQIYR